MKKIVFLLTALAIMATSTVALAAEAEVGSAAMGAVGMVALAAGLAIGLGAFGPGIGQGLTMLGALQGIARNPEAAGTIRTNMIIGLALIESLCIYALVVALILLYAFPLSTLITGVFAA